MTIQSQSVPPSITQVVSPSGFTPNGDTCGDTGLFLSGTAAPGAYLLISDGENDLSITRASPRGRWSVAVEAVPGQHSYAVRQLNKPRSLQWLINIDPGAIKPSASPVITATLTENFETGVLGPIPEGSSRAFPNLHVTPDQGAVSVYREDPSPSPSIIEGICIRFEPLGFGGGVRFLLNTSAIEVVFGVYQVGFGFHGPESWTAYDEQGTVIAQSQFVIGPRQRVYGNGQKIKAIGVSVWDGVEYMLIDNLIINT
ncbi:hypothetical protein [Pseudomonas quasicaspiana]|uniref:hypothetical protein n=1 Tax=Pseudomonas quasicaspiana TaxID=2829821 RepID=UPI0011C3711A|nr:hypothetical protein [Pseudomonas quasicaspiana]MCD5980360.1 hypothetical protein [Pseudomonas quasicaspiana]